MGMLKSIVFAVIVLAVPELYSVIAVGDAPPAGVPSPTPGARVLRDGGKFFAEQLEVQLHSIAGAQLSSPWVTNFNPEFSSCVWQRTLSENDCPHTSKKKLYPLSFYDERGILVSDGYGGPVKPERELLEDLLKQDSVGGAFSSERAHCVGANAQTCAYRVFTSFRARCLGDMNICARAREIELYYFIVYQKRSKSGKNTYDIIGNLDSKKPVIIKTEDVILLGHKSCPAGKQLFGGYDLDTLKPVCFFAYKEVQTLCRQETSGAGLALLADFGSACSKENVAGCKTFCDKILKYDGSPNACVTRDLHMNPASPQVVRCGRDGFGYERAHYLNSPKKDDNPCGSDEVHLPEVVEGLPACSFELFWTCFWHKPLFRHQCVRKADLLWSFGDTPVKDLPTSP